MSAPACSVDDWLVMSTGPGLLGFSVLVNEMRTNSECTAPRPSSRNCGFSETTVSSPVRMRVDRLGRLRLLGADRLEREPVDGEAVAQRRLALEHERDAAGGFDEVGGVHDRVVVDGLGEESACTGGKLPLMSSDVTVFLSALNAMSSRSSRLVMATEIVPRVSEGLADLLQGARRDERGDGLGSPATVPPSQSISRTATR